MKMSIALVHYQGGNKEEKEEQGEEEEEEMESKRRSGHFAKQSPTPHFNSISSCSSPSECYYYYSPRALLSRIRVLLSRRPQSPGRSSRAGDGVGCRVRFPGYCAHRKEKMKKNNGEEEEEEEEVVVVEEEEEEEEEEREVDGSSSSSGKGKEGFPLNLGMGAGLVVLLAKSAVELNKMVELRKQMEILLTDIKSEIDQKKDVSFSIAESKTALISHSDCYEDGSISNSDTFLEGAENAVKDNTGGGKNKMDEELEAELEHLQLNVEDINSSVNLRQEETAEKHYGGGNELAEEQSPPHSGVSARELDRRLHELLETRQRERIAELESALECAERDLREKERELRWWRRSARVVSQQREEMLSR